MTLRSRWHACTDIPWVRAALMGFGVLLMILAPVAGLLPGPGGIFLFGGGLALALKYSDWAKRKYVAFKRAHPRKGEWADWGLRRPSAQRRRARDKQAALAEAAEAPSPLVEAVVVQTMVVETLLVETPVDALSEDEAGGALDGRNESAARARSG